MTKHKLIIFLKHFREGTIQIGDEIVNVCGQSVRGLTILQVRELLEDAYTDRTKTDIDMVICRYANSECAMQTMTRSRKKSLDTYATDLDDSPGAGYAHLNEYAYTALK